MRVLVLSDIHANIVALDSVLASAESYDEVWCLGDVVGYGPAPNECIERLKDLETKCVAGNHDGAVLGKLDVREFNPDARRAIQWTQTVLKPENRDWLERIPDGKYFPENDIVLVHASPRHPIWEYILSTATAAENMPYFEASICLFGHTHVPAAYRQAESKKLTTALDMNEGKPLVLAKKMLVNPGSVGQPRDNDPRAAFAVSDLDARIFTYLRVEYDIRATQKAMADADLPRRLIERLAYGV